MVDFEARKNAQSNITRNAHNSRFLSFLFTLGSVRNSTCLVDGCRLFPSLSSYYGISRTASTETTDTVRHPSG